MNQLGFFFRRMEQRVACMSVGTEPFVGCECSLVRVVGVASHDGWHLPVYKRLSLITGPVSKGTCTWPGQHYCEKEWVRNCAKDFHQSLAKTFVTLHLSSSSVLQQQMAGWKRFHGFQNPYCEKFRLEEMEFDRETWLLHLVVYTGK